MPGVIVQTSTRSGPATPMRSPSGQFFVVGLAERGATDAPILMRDMADVDALLGARTAFSAMHDQLKTFFAEGGLQAYAARIVGPAATKGTLTINDRDGSPGPTVKIDAASAGAWSSKVTIQIADGSATDTFRVIVRLDGDVVEDITNLKTVPEAVIKFKESFYVRLTDQGSDATTDANKRPAVTAETPLSAGTDDRASVDSATYIAALSRFKKELGDGAVAIPGQTGSTVWEAMIEHCEQNNRLAILAAAANETAGSLKSLSATVDSEFAGLFVPWVGISDGAGGQRFISPEGAVAGRRAAAHDQVGAWRAPAGVMGKMNTVVSVQQMFTADEAQDLDDAKVSVIRTVKGSVRLYGWRSLSSNVADYAYLTNRDVLNTLVVQAEDALEDYVFAPVDRKNQLLSAINAELVGLVEPMRAAGGLYENIDPVSNEQIDPGYKVETGSSVNTPQTLANNEVRARLYVRVSPTGGLVTLTIVKVGLLAGM